MEFTEDEIDELAENMFDAEYPDVIWGVQAMPRSGKRTATQKEKAAYKKKARLALEAEAEANSQPDLKDKNALPMR